MARKFPDFVEAYRAYADDDFIPPQFNQWAALSIVAGALERRVWLPWNDTFSYFPNVYVLLVSMPGDGKSVALNKAVGILQEVNRRTSQLNIMPNQVTEAKFIELMGYGRSFTEHTVAGKELTHFQNAGYYWASEASNSLRNIFGDFIACLTDFYDCPASWARATKKDGKKIQLQNVCMNLIAGSTFDYLGKLVNDENIMGGFASRLIYVISRNKAVVEQAFQLGGQSAEEKEERRVYREALIHDLTEISQMVGAMQPEMAFGRAWEAWYPQYERDRRALKSEKAQSILARANTNVLKIAMLLSASESGDRVLRLRHWERALELVMDVQRKAPDAFREARANSSGPQSQSNLQSKVVHLIKVQPGITVERMKALLKLNAPGPQVDTVVQAMFDAGALRRGTGGSVELLGNPDDHF